MTNWSITVTREELSAVCDLLCAHRPTEVAGEGVWVRSVDGHRVWSVRTDDVTWEVTGTPIDSPLAPRCLPDRLVWNARQFTMLDGSVEVTIEIPDDLVALAHSAVGRCVIDLPRGTEVPRLPRYFEEAATATTSVATFVDLVRRAHVAPWAPEGAPVPTAFLVVDDGEVLVHVDWTIRGGARSTYGAPARTTGEAVRPVRLSALVDLLQFVDDATELTVVVPKHDTVPLVVTGAGWRFALDPVAHGVARLHDQLEDALRSACDGFVHVVDTGEFTVDVDGRRIHVELVDSPDEAIRCTTAVCVDLEPTLELLSQLNEFNASMRTVRLWLGEGTVWARADVPIASIDDIGAVLHAIDRQVRGFDVFLGAIVSEGSR